MTNTIRSLYDEALKLIDDKNVFNRDILFLMEACFNVTYNDILIHGDKTINDEDFREKLNRLIEGEPVEYIVNYADFYGLRFKVTQDTLIPRNETEELIEKTIRYISSLKIESPLIIDIGSGSGCIAITLMKNIEGAKVDSVDISTKALEVAKSNNESIGTNVNFYLSDCLTEPSLNSKKYDVIISNPPYIDRDTFVQESVLKYEPHSALFADEKGLAVYRKIFKDVKYVEKEKCLIALEISPDLVEGLTNLRNEYLRDYKYSFEKDMNGLVRFMFLYRD